ncbi:MAG: LysR family transcriptional regulator [Acidobacteria bacterium]|nr:LysR family transcriptional regulator [Acidobacteriota bacterium]MBI3656874.1 LysR family transcriptional regulator [Acidobacteriota bacterium]
MDAQSLKLFLDLYHSRNFTRTSERNYLTQPAVSHQIQRLEHELGVRLFERTKRRVVVTEEGRLLFPIAKDLLARFDEIRTLFAERKGLVIGRLKISTTVSIGLYILPSYLKQFIKRFPDVDLHVEYQLPDTIYDLLLKGDSDLGLLAYPERQSDIVVLPFMVDEFVLICPPHHIWARKKHIKIAEIEGQDFIGLAEATPTGKAIRQRLKDLGITVRLRTEYNNIEVVKKTVETGLGISLVPRGVVTQEVKNRTLISLSFSDVNFERPLGIVYRKSKVVTKPMQEFLKILTATAPSTPEESPHPHSGRVKP